MDRLGTATVARTTRINLGALAPRGPHGSGGAGPSDPRWAEVAQPCSLIVGVRVKTKNWLNFRGHWNVRHRLTKQQYEAVAAALAAHPEKRDVFSRGCVVSLKRVSVGKLDSDGLQAALKGIRDGVGMWLRGGTPGQHDGDDSGISWRYSQASLGRDAFGVTITLETTP